MVRTLRCSNKPSRLHKSASNFERLAADNPGNGSWSRTVEAGTTACGSILRSAGMQGYATGALQLDYTKYRVTEMQDVRFAVGCRGWADQSSSHGAIKKSLVCSPPALHAFHSS